MNQNWATEEFYEDTSVQSLSYVWLCNPKDYNTPGLPVHHQLPEFTQMYVHWIGEQYEDTTAAAAKSPQACPTLCDPIDGSPLGFPVPGILQARTLEWVAISFSNEDTTTT